MEFKMQSGQCRFEIKISNFRCLKNSYSLQGQSLIDNMDHIIYIYKEEWVIEWQLSSTFLYAHRCVIDHKKGTNYCLVKFSANTHVHGFQGRLLWSPEFVTCRQAPTWSSVWCELLQHQLLNQLMHCPVKDSRNLNFPALLSVRRTAFVRCWIVSTYARSKVNLN